MSAAVHAGAPLSRMREYVPPAGDGDLLAQARKRIAEEIGRLEGALAGAGDKDRRAEASRGELKLRILRQLACALASSQPRDLPPDGAGLGSMLTLEDCLTGEHREYLLMTGDLVDLEGGQVSLGSPIGRAVIGEPAGATVDVALPRGVRSYRIAALTTLPEMLGLAPEVAVPPPAATRHRAPGRGAHAANLPPA